MTWSVNVECSEIVNQSNGMDKCLLRVHSGEAINGEHIITSLLRSRCEMERGKFYRVTFEEITSL